MLRGEAGGKGRAGVSALVVGILAALRAASDPGGREIQCFSESGRY